MEAIINLILILILRKLIIFNSLIWYDWSFKLNYYLFKFRFRCSIL